MAPRREYTYLFEYFRWRPLWEKERKRESVILTIPVSEVDTFPKPAMLVRQKAYELQRLLEPGEWRVEPRRVARVAPEHLAKNADGFMEASMILQEIWRYSDEEPFLFFRI